MANAIFTHENLVLIWKLACVIDLTWRKKDRFVTGNNFFDQFFSPLQVAGTTPARWKLPDGGGKSGAQRPDSNRARRWGSIPSMKLWASYSHTTSRVIMIAVALRRVPLFLKIRPHFRNRDLPQAQKHSAHRPWRITKYFSFPVFYSVWQINKYQSPARPPNCPRLRQ